MSLAPGKPGLGTSLFHTDENQDLPYFDEVNLLAVVNISLWAEFNTGQSSESRT